MAYNWLAYSADTQIAQRKINVQALLAGKCPPVLEDGKLGPNTCGAGAQYAGKDPAIAAMLKNCQKTNVAAADGCAALPWMVQSSATETLQAGLNARIAAKGYCAIKIDGILGGDTCAAVKSEFPNALSAIGCKSVGTLKVCATTPAAPTTTPSASTPTPVVTAPSAPVVQPSAPVVTAPPVTADTPKTVPVAPPVTTPVKVVTTTPPLTQAEIDMINQANKELDKNNTGPAPVKAAGMDTTTMILIGLGAVAVIGGGVYFMTKKKK